MSAIALSRIRRIRRDGMSPLRQCGQAIIEYIVVLAFGVIVLLKPFSLDDVTTPGAPKDQAPALKQLANAIKDYHKHYTYAMAIASIPDCDYQFAYDKSANAGDIATLTGQIAVGFDRCIDWQNPAVPGLAVSGSLSMNLASNFKTIIQDMVTNMVKDAMKDFLNPASLLSGFSPIPLP